MTEIKAKKEPLIRIAKRSSVSLGRAIAVRAAAIVMALLVCAVLIFFVTGLNPLDVYKAMFTGAFGTKRRMWITFRDSAILLCAALAVTPAFRMKFWNIGAEGQILMGGAATAAVMIHFGANIPAWQLFALMIVCSLAAGMIWGLIPAFFKAFWNTNETLFTLMMNYVAIQFVSYLSIKWEAVKGCGSIGIINGDTSAGWISSSFLPGIFGRVNYSISVGIVLILTLLVYIYMKFTKHGYEIAVVGESENTAKYAGINVRKVMLRTMAISGAVCGLTGLLVVSGSSHTLSTVTAGGNGFTAIMVSWLAKFNPLFMILISLFLTFLGKGAAQIASQFNLNESASEIITGVILFFIIGSEFFLNYKIIIGRSNKASKEGD